MFQRKKTGHIQRIKKLGVNSESLIEKNTKGQWSHAFQCGDNWEYTQLNPQPRMRVSVDIFRYANPREFVSYVPFLRELLEEMPHQNDGMNQQEEEHGVQEVSLEMSSDNSSYTAGPGTSSHRAAAGRGAPRGTLSGKTILKGLKRSLTGSFYVHIFHQRTRVF